MSSFSYLLWNALAHYDAASVKKALDLGADPNEAFDPAVYPALSFASGDRPLHVLLSAPRLPRNTARWAHKQHQGNALGSMLSLLMEGGADFGLCDAQGRTPLMRHIQQQHLKLPTEIDKALVRTAIGSINQQDFNGKTALHHAAYGLRPSLIKLLLKSGAQPTVVDNSGQTALLSLGERWKEERLFNDKTSRNKPLATLKALIKGGSDINAGDKRGYSLPQVYWQLPLAPLAENGWRIPQGKMLDDLLELKAKQLEHINKVVALDAGADLRFLYDQGVSLPPALAQDAMARLGVLSAATQQDFIAPLLASMQERYLHDTTQPTDYRSRGPRL